jgi:hypothetical protein
VTTGPDDAVRWVHPSVRDLVIDFLQVNDRERARFLRAGGAESITLALSVGGGVEGERVMPLLKSPEDWSAATVRVCELLRGSNRERNTVLATLASVAKQEPEAFEAELRQLSNAGLAELLEHWTSAPSVIAPRALRLYYEASIPFDPLPSSPPLSRTWDWYWSKFRGVLKADLSDDALFTDAMEFLELVDLLDRYEPRWMERVRFPHDAADDLDRVAVRLVELVDEIDELSSELDTDEHGTPYEPEAEEMWEVQSLQAVSALLRSLNERFSGITDEAAARADWASEQARARESRSEAWDEYEQEMRQRQYDDEAWRGSEKSELGVEDGFSIERLFADL